MNSVSIAIAVAACAVAGCSSSAGGGQGTAGGAEAAALPALPVLPPDTLPAPPADVMLVSIERTPGTTEVIPGQCIDLDGITYVWNALTRPSFEQLPYAYEGTAKLSSFMNVAFVTPTHDIVDDAPYRILTDEEARTLTVDFTAGSWYPRDFGREPVKHYLTGCVHPSTPEGATFAFARKSPQVHEYGATADGGNPAGWSYTVKKAPGVSLPKATHTASATGVNQYATILLGSITVTCPVADKVPYCELARIPFKTEGVSVQSVHIDGGSYGAWSYCGTNCAAATVGRAVMPGQSVTILVIGTPFQAQYAIDMSGMTWKIDRFTVLTEAVGSLSLTLKGTATSSGGKG